MREKILVIEDEQSINDLICMNLEAAGYQTFSFFDGNQAHLHLEEYREWDLALLDVMLPGRNGFELLEDFQRLKIPVIFLTARGDLSSKVKGLKEGAEDYLVKPFEMLELLVRIEKVLARNRKEEECIRIRDVEIFPLERVVKKNGRKAAADPAAEGGAVFH